jgi:hypothetical protein
LQLRRLIRASPAQLHQGRLSRDDIHNLSWVRRKAQCTDHGEPQLCGESKYPSEGREGKVESLGWGVIVLLGGGVVILIAADGVGITVMGELITVIKVSVIVIGP